MTNLLLLGFLIGMRHALEADHLAAIASISSKNHTISTNLKHGLVWGIGHTTTLFLFGSIVILMDNIIPENVAQFLEFSVGIMLIFLGLNVIQRIIKEKVHYHAHKHQNGKEHFHAHSHIDEKDHNTSSHTHTHTSFPYKTLFIGFMHGMAGSAALILLTLETINSISVSLFYMLLFGIGSIVGMTAISIVITIPLRASCKLTWLHNSLQASIGVLTLGLGITIVSQTTFWLI